MADLEELPSEFQEVEELPAEFRVQEEELPEEFRAVEVPKETLPELKPLDTSEEDPWIMSSSVKKGLVQELSQKYGVPEEALIKHVYMRGGTVEGETRPLEFAAVALGEASPVALGDAAAFAQKKMYDPAQRAAFDEITDQVDKNRSWLRVAGNIGMGIVTPMGAAKVWKPAAKALNYLGEVPFQVAAKAGGGVAGRLAAAGTGAIVGGATGAAAGVTVSEEGQETQNAILGGVMGGVLGSFAGASSRAAKATIKEGEEILAESMTKGGQVKAEGDKMEQVLNVVVGENSKVDGVKLGVIQKMDMPEPLLVETRLQRGKPLVSKQEVETVTAGLSKAVRELREQEPENFKTLLDHAWEHMRDEEFEAVRDIAARKGIPADDAVVFRAMRNELEDFSKYAKRDVPNKMKGDSLANAIARLSLARRGQGELGLKARWEEFKKTRYLEDPRVREEIRAAKFNEESGKVTEFYNKFLRPTRYIAEKIDRKFGTEFLPLVDRISANTNIAKTNAHRLRPLIDTFDKTFKKELRNSGLNREEAMREMARSIEGRAKNDSITKLFPESIASFKHNFEEFRNAANGMYKEEIIRAIEGYVPHQAMDFLNGAIRITDEIQDIAQDSGFLKIARDSADKKSITQKYDEVYAQLQQPNLTDSVREALNERLNVWGRLKEVKKAMEWYKVGAEVNTLDDVLRGFGKLKAAPMSPGSVGARDIAARAAHIRTGEGVPSLIREYDLVKLQERWALDTMKKAAVDKELIQLHGLADRLQKAKAPKEYVEYVRNLAIDIIKRTRENTMAGAARSWSENLQVSFLEAANSAPPLLRKPLRAMAHFPEVGTFMMSQLYPSVLNAAVNIKSTLVNMAQVGLMAVPELGYQYGTLRMVKAYTELAGEMATNRSTLRGITPTSREALERGFRGSEWSKENFEMMSDATSTLQSRGLHHAVDTINSLNTLLMAPFSAVEMLNRLTTFKMGKSVARDLISAVSKKGEAPSFTESGALKYYQRLPEGYRRKIQPALEEIRRITASGAKDTDSTQMVNRLTAEVEDSIAGHLVGKNIYNYDRVSAGGAARNMLPALMTFTKFPLNILGDVVNSYEVNWEKLGDKNPLYKLVNGGLHADVAKRYLLPLGGLWAADALLRQVPELSEEGLVGDNSLRDILSGGGRSGLVGYAPLASATGLTSGSWAQPPVLAPLRSLGGLASNDMQTAKKEAMNTLRYFVPAPITTLFHLAGLAEERGIADFPLVGEE